MHLLLFTTHRSGWENIVAINLNCSETNPLAHSKVNYAFENGINAVPSDLNFIARKNVRTSDREFKGLCLRKNQVSDEK